MLPIMRKIQFSTRHKLTTHIFKKQTISNTQLPKLPKHSLLPTSLRSSRSPRPPRLCSLLLRNINPHSLIPHLGRPTLMSLRHTSNLIAPPPRPNPGSKDNLLLTRVIALSKVVAVARLALVVAAALCAETRVGGCAFCAEAPVAVVVCVAVDG
jgi:hypothetical protein